MCSLCLDRLGVGGPDSERPGALRPLDVQGANGGFLNIVATDGAAHGTNDCRHKEQLLSKGGQRGIHKMCEVTVAETIGTIEIASNMWFTALLSHSI